MQTNCQPSSVALHAARTILRNFAVRERDKIEATEHNIAVVVDVCTQVRHLAPALKILVKTVPWYQPQKFPERLDALRQQVQTLETLRKRMPRYHGTAPSGEGYHCSAPALQTARQLWHYYEFTRKAKLGATENNLAILVDVCTDVFRLERAIDQITQTSLWSGTAELRSKFDALRGLVRELELLSNRLPAIRPTDLRVVTVAERKPSEPRLTRERLSELRSIQTRLAQARTVLEEQEVLQRARLVTQTA